jgi:hypothetical protein
MTILETTHALADLYAADMFGRVDPEPEWPAAKAVAWALDHVRYGRQQYGSPKATFEPLGSTAHALQAAGFNLAVRRANLSIDEPDDESKAAHNLAAALRVLAQRVQPTEIVEITPDA